MSLEEQKWSPPPTGSPCWIEIPALDVPASKKFYSSLFPLWQFRPATGKNPAEKYTDERIAMFSYAGKMGLAGGIVKMKDDYKHVPQTTGSGTTIYHYVESIEETQKKIEELGGKLLSGKEPEGEDGFYMYVSDIAGNRFGIYECKKSG